jgi:hypothetical protein
MCLFLVFVGREIHVFVLGLSQRKVIAAIVCSLLSFGLLFFIGYLNHSHHLSRFLCLNHKNEFNCGKNFS